MLCFGLKQTFFHMLKIKILDRALNTNQSQLILGTKNCLVHASTEVRMEV